MTQVPIKTMTLHYSRHYLPTYADCILENGELCLLKLTWEQAPRMQEEFEGRDPALYEKPVVLKAVSDG